MPMNLSANKALSAKVNSPRPAAPTPLPVTGARGWQYCRPGSRAPPCRPLQKPPCSSPTPAAPSAYVSGADGDAELAAFQQRQAAAPRPGAAEEARTILDQAKHGVLCTLSSGGDAAGFPSSSVVEFACDAAGRPFFATSSLSPHTGDMAADGRVSLTVLAPSFQGMDSGRVTVQGVVKPVSEEDKKALREVFLKKYPSAFYVDFGDFKWFRVEELKAVRYNGGFGRAPPLTVEDFLAAKPDPVYPFSAPVCGHMNADHLEDSKAMIQHYCGLGVDAVRMLDLDRLGINCSVTRNGQSFKLRLPFPRPAEDRKSIKEVIVEMTKTAKAAAAAASGST